VNIDKTLAETGVKRRVLAEAQRRRERRGRELFIFIIYPQENYRFIRFVPEQQLCAFAPLRELLLIYLHKFKEKYVGY